MKDLGILFAIVVGFVVLASACLAAIVLPAAHFFEHGEWYFGLPWLILSISGLVTTIIGSAIYVSTK